MTLRIGRIKRSYTLKEERLGLIYRRPSYLPTGTHPSPRSVSAWRLLNSSGILSSIRRLTLSSHWSLMGNIAIHHWGVARGRTWLVLLLHCSATVTRRDSMQITMIILCTKKTFPRQESVSLVMNRMIVTAVTLESDLVQEDIPRMTTRVAT